jgi:pSer/pThr/pTyr-binding forkhead associated (FHA) protein
MGYILVVVTLTPLDSLDFPRVFILDPSRMSIEIGRASKTASKGLAAAVDNAWFDSPIMSRSHAELEYVASEKVGLDDTMGYCINNSYIP